MRVDVETFESGKKKLRIQIYPDKCGRGLSYIVKLRDEGCASLTKRVGDKKNFTTQEVRKSAAHCFILLKIFFKIQECRKLFWYFYPKIWAQRLSQNLTDRATFSRQNQANQSNAWI